MQSTRVTPKRNLRTGTPVWLRNGVPHIPTRLDGNVEADVAIVGAGVTGALVTDALLQAGQRVAVLDRRGPAKGSTAASTALLQFELDKPLTLLSKSIGSEKAARAYWRSAAAVGYLRGRVMDLGIRCGFAERNTVYLPGDVLDIKGLRKETEARRAIGLRSRFIGADELRALTKIEGEGAILSGGNGELDPVAFVASLWRSAIGLGARVLAPADVVDLESTRSGVILTTSEGLEVRARFAVFATGYETFKHVPKAGHKVVSTWVMVTKRQKARLWPSRALIWEASDPYHYLRTTSDGRIIIGGADEDFSDEKARDALIPSKVRGLQKRLKSLIPDVDATAAFSWAGAFGTSASGLPIIGRVPGSNRCFAVLGYGGNGITFSAVAAQLIQRAVMGLRDPDTDLFAPSNRRARR